MRRIARFAVNRRALAVAAAFAVALVAMLAGAAWGENYRY